jgi:hypothetical protein
MESPPTQKQTIQQRLEVELEKLKHIMSFGHELRVRWVPREISRIAGVVKNDWIYVYDEDEELAIDTLKHEFIDYAISKVVEPYKEVTNRLIALINDDAYQRKERLVASICHLLSE